MAWHRYPGVVNPNPIILIGLRAAGKTTLGRELADVLQVGFQDLDDLALTHSGATSVAEVFARSGEPAWRHAEQKAFALWLASPSEVLACGGGAPCIPEVRASMQSSGACVVYLHAGVDALVARRERQDRDRPALFGTGGLREEVARTYEERDAIFRDLARHIVEVDVQESSDSLTSLRTIFNEECLGEGPTA